MTNIIFSMHTGTQSVTVFMNDNLIDSFKRRFIQKRTLCLCSGSVVSLFETILVKEIEQNHAILLYSANVNH